MDHQATQVPEVSGDGQEQLVTRALLARLELLGQQAYLAMALQVHVEKQEFLGTTDIRVQPVIRVLMGLLEQLDSEEKLERLECGQSRTPRLRRQQRNQTALARQVRQVIPVRQDSPAGSVSEDSEDVQDIQE